MYARIIVLAVAIAAHLEAAALLNEDILALLKAKVETSLIIKIVSTMPGSYLVDGNAVSDLRKAGATDRLVALMRKRRATATTRDLFRTCRTIIPAS